MAIKVIKAGKRPMEHPMAGRCTDCKCEIECVRGDCKISEDRNEILYYVQCPTCGVALYVIPKN